MTGLIVTLAVTATALAQDGRERGLKRIGATKVEIASGRAKNIQLWAVLIGVSRYKNGDQNLGGYEIKNLKNAADDAQAIADFLRSEEGGAFPEDHILLLKDEQATRTEVESAIKLLKARARADDFFMIFIAAHGVLSPQYDAKEGRTKELPYFVLYDSDLRDMARTGMPMEAFQQAVREIPAKKGIVLSDTCHSAGMVMPGRGGEATVRANSILVERLKLNEGSGVGFIWAADQTETAGEYDNLSQGRGQGQGVFTYCLLEGLRGNADKDSDGMVTYVELKNYVRDKVPEFTNNTQHPGGNTTSIEANDIPLSIVPSSCNNPADCGSIVIRAPELEGVTVSIDGAAVGTINNTREITRRVPGGERLLSFTHGSVTRQRRARVQSGKTRFVEVNLAFSSGEEESLAPPPEEIDAITSVSVTDDQNISKEARELFLDGVDLFNRQEMDKAIQKLDEAIKRSNGSYPDALVYRGRAEQSLGRKADAVRSFQQAVAARKTDYEAETLLLEAKFNLNLDPTEVEARLKEIIKRHPYWDFPRVVLGDVLFFRRDMIGAERELRNAIKNNPNSAPAHLILADVLMHQESVDKLQKAVDEAKLALALFAQVSKKKIAAARSLKGLSISHLIFGGGRFRNESAMAEVNHKVGEALTRLAYYDTESGKDYSAQLDEARTALNAAKQMAKGDKARMALVLQTSSLNHLLKGDLKRAIEEGESAIKMATLPLAHYYLSQAYRSDQKFAPAVTHLSRYIELSKAEVSADELKKSREELQMLIRMRDSNRQNK
jgi:uncharacterized caspase-like protein/tetratricopeptide (TPR) repeat protein